VAILKSRILPLQKGALGRGIDRIEATPLCGNGRKQKQARTKIEKRKNSLNQFDQTIEVDCHHIVDL